MGRDTGRLTALAVKRATRRGLYHDGAGLYLQVAANGSKSWIFRYGAGGGRHHGLGALHTVNLAEARQAARVCRQLLLEGRDPIAERRARKAAAQAEAAKAITFQAAADRYIDAHAPGWKHVKSAQQWRGSLATYAYPTIGAVSVAAVDTQLVMKVLEPIWHAVPETATRVRMRIEKVLAWAAVRGYRSSDNPARWRGHLDHLLARPAQSTKHFAALPYAELPTFMAELRQRTGRAALALEFLILTAARTAEVLGATWGEFDLEGRTWTIPERRMKSGREHRVALSDRAVEILQGLPRDGERLFALSNMALLVLLQRRMRRQVTAHGFRSTFSTWASETTDHPHVVVEAALAHVVGDQTERAYRRGDLFDKRRALMRDWAAYCASRPEAGHLPRHLGPYREEPKCPA